MGGRLNLNWGTLNLDEGTRPPRPPYNLSTGKMHAKTLLVKIIERIFRL